VAAAEFTEPGAGGLGQSVSGQGGRYYPTDGLVALIATTQTAVDEALKNEALQPLRQHFPKALAQVSAPGEAATPEVDALRVFRRLKDTVGVLEKMSDDLGVDLVFRTTPVETEDSHLAFDNCNRCFTVTSQGGEHRFYRGRYYIKASRDGYVPYEGWLDLVEDPRSILECDLVRVRRAGNGHTSTCSLRVQ
jgi:hypothetical protein